MHTVKDNAPREPRRGKSTTSDPPRVDGRHLRSERTRTAIVGALLSLADQGELAPTAQQIADTAGVAIRSIRQHFETREALFVAAAAEHAKRTKGARSDIDASLPKDERIAAFTKARARDLEATAPLRRAALLEEEASPIIARTMSTTRTHRRKEVARVFEREIAAAKDPETTLDLIDLVCGSRGYDSLRREHGLSEAQARARMEKMLHVVLG
jgi:AcrR family transcriptional regulator